MTLRSFPENKRLGEGRGPARPEEVSKNTATGDPMTELELGNTSSMILMTWMIWGLVGRLI